MDQEEIRTILAISRTGSFTRAAETLHVTQSTVTARVQQLERELGVAIWDRNTRRLILTGDGEKLMPLFERAELLYQRIRETVDASRFFRHVTVGAVHSQWSSGILPLLRGWMDSRPGITWRLISGHSRDLLELLRDGTLDIAFSYLPSQEPGLRSTLLAEQPLILIGARSEVHAMNTEDVKARSLAFLDWGPPFSEWFQEEFDGFDPAVQVDQAPLLVQILLQGDFFGFMPPAMARDALKLGSLHPTPYVPKKPVPMRTLFLVSSERALARPQVMDLWNYVQTAGPPLLLN